jgi:hypothetical protein
VNRRAEYANCDIKNVHARRSGNADDDADQAAAQQGADLLKLLPKHALLVDLAAPPGGIDREAAEALGLKFVWARGMGARAPITVGRSQWSGISSRIEGILKERV